jgi:hypothetical protein
MHDAGRPPFDSSTLVDAAELGEWLRLEADEIKMLARAGVFPRDGQGRFNLIAAIRGYLRLEEARAAHALAAREERAGRKVAHGCQASVGASLA